MFLPQLCTTNDRGTEVNCTYSRPCFNASYTSSTLLGCGSCELLLLLLDLCPHRWGFLGFVSDFFCTVEFPMNELHLETHEHTPAMRNNHVFCTTRPAQLYKYMSHEAISKHVWRSECSIHTSKVKDKDFNIIIVVPDWCLKSVKCMSHINAIAY